MTGRVLVVDDQAEQSAVIREVAEEMGYQVLDTTDPRDAVTMFQGFRPDIVFLDVVMPDMDGFDVLKALGRAGCAVPVVLISGYNPRYLEDAAKLATFYGVASLSTMTKPLRVQQIRAALRAAGDAAR